MEEQHVKRLVQATKNSLDEMSVEQLKEIESHIIKELGRRTIKVPEKEDDNLTYSLKRMDIKNSYFSRATGDDK
jgi:hypothetical protein